VRRDDAAAAAIYGRLGVRAKAAGRGVGAASDSMFESCPSTRLKKPLWRGPGMSASQGEERRGGSGCNRLGRDELGSAHQARRGRREKEATGQQGKVVRLGLRAETKER
jgi:hypothetical protein